MARRIALILLLMWAQIAQNGAAGDSRACPNGNEQPVTMTLAAAHRAVCGDSCCCPPDNCPCMASRETDREAPSPPVAPPVRSEVSGIDLLLPHSVAARDELRASAATRAPVSARAPMSAGRPIHTVIGIWLT